MTTDGFETLKPGDRVYLKNTAELNQFVVQSIHPDILPFQFLFHCYLTASPIRLFI